MAGARVSLKHFPTQSSPVPASPGWERGLPLTSMEFVSHEISGASRGDHSSRVSDKKQCHLWWSKWQHQDAALR